MRRFKCITGLLSEKPLAVNVLRTTKKSWNLTQSFFAYVFIILGQIKLEKFIFNQIWDFWTACLHIDCQLRVFSYNRENLLLPIQIKLSKKPETFWCNVLNFFESKLKFEGFEKKIRLRDQLFLKLLTQENIPI